MPGGMRRDRGLRQGCAAPRWTLDGLQAGRPCAARGSSDAANADRQDTDTAALTSRAARSVAGTGGRPPGT